MPPLPDAAQKVVVAFHVPDAQLRGVVEAFKKEVELGLAKDGQQIKCLPSFVTNLPPADLVSSSLALDLGGTNFRVCSVSMDRGKVKLEQEKFTIPAKAKETQEGLFGFLAESIKTFIEKKGADGTMNLGFTFSFPVQQTSICSGTLVTWTKGFSTPGVVGVEVVSLLQSACARIGLSKLNITALVNDTVGTLMAHAVVAENTRVGMIVGTGFNAAYVEKRERIGKMGPVKAGEAPHMVVNLESGNFGSGTDALPLSIYDKSTISSSTNPAEQWFEKMVSGKYLGELARLACLDLHSAGLLWKDLPLSALMNERHGLDTEVMSRSVAIEKAEVAGYLEKETGMKTEDGDAEVLLALFDAIGKRSARLSGALIAGLVEHMGAKGCTIAVDGSVFEHYPGFRPNMKQAVDALLGEKLGSEVHISLGKDGSGVGAGVIAALA